MPSEAGTSVKKRRRFSPSGLIQKLIHALYAATKRIDVCIAAEAIVPLLTKAEFAQWEDGKRRPGL